MQKLASDHLTALETLATISSRIIGSVVRFTDSEDIPTAIHHCRKRWVLSTVIELIPVLGPLISFQRSIRGLLSSDLVVCHHVTAGRCRYGLI